MMALQADASVLDLMTLQLCHPGTRCPGKSDSTEPPQETPAASHPAVDGLEALFALEEPHEAGTPHPL